MGSLWYWVRKSWKGTTRISLKYLHSCEANKYCFKISWCIQVFQRFIPHFRILYPEVVPKLRELWDNGYKVVISFLDDFPLIFFTGTPRYKSGHWYTHMSLLAVSDHPNAYKKSDHRGFGFWVIACCSCCFRGLVSVQMHL